MEEMKEFAVTAATSSCSETENVCKSVQEESQDTANVTQETQDSETVEVESGSSDKLTKEMSIDDNKVSQPENSEDQTELVKTETCSTAEGSAAATVQEESDASVDPYAYVKRDEFTSEIFKIEIQNLPRRYGISQLKKRLISQKLNPIKLKTPNNGNYAFVTFRSEEERENALKVLEGHVWKGKAFKVKKAHPAADPLLKRRLETAVEGESAQKKLKLTDTDHEENKLSIEDQLKNAVTPFWKIPYAEQLETKQSTIMDFMRKLSKEAEKNNHNIKSLLAERRSKFDGSCCEILPIKQSPVLVGYRNKCEFTIGQSQEGKDRVVGFRLGSYKDGVYVAEPYQIHALLPEPMKKVVQEVQMCLADSKWTSFNAINHAGHWTMLTVRTTQSGDVMAVIAFNNAHELSQNDLEETKKAIVDYFIEGPGKDCGVTSFYFLPRQEGQRDLPFEHLFGCKSIQEDLLGFKFRISPDAFFQVNTLAAEVLYSTIAEWSNVTPETTILDVCCGTGTIGITMAKKAKRIIGIEMVQQAIDDARANAALNAVKNTEYYCGKAEDVLPGLMNRCRGEDAVAVVDPPRSGLHYKVIQAIRRAEYLTRLVYVSCNPNGALQNLVDLMRAKSNRIKGRPFLPVKAVAVDLFPHTKHCELVILFERQEEEK